MPQFEIKDTESPGTVVKVRARSVDEAVRQHLGLPLNARMTIERGTEFDALEGWKEVIIGGDVVARVRSFQRMQFRRA